jgi:hypothetical protein
VAAGPPKAAGDCAVVRGRIDFWNGAPTVRMWLVGTNRMLGVANDLPPNVTRLWDTAPDRWEVSIFGDFEVCAITPSRPGVMQSVTVKAADRLTMRARHTVLR